MKKKRNNITKYVIEEAPQFRHLLKYKANDISNIKPDLTTDKLDDELYKIKRDFDKELKQKQLDYLSALKNDDDYQKILPSDFRDYVNTVSEANGAVLAEYVLRRKFIIELLENAINKDENGKFTKEAVIHNLIYPMHASSNETSYDNHNLWLLDEKLAFCNYISSDMPFVSSTKERSDILVLDKVFAVSEEKTTEAFLTQLFFLNLNVQCEMIIHLTTILLINFMVM